MTSCRRWTWARHRKDLPDKCQLIDQRLKELGSAEKKTEN